MPNSTIAAAQRSGVATGRIRPATAAPPAAARTAYSPSAVATPRPAPAPTSSRVRADRLRISTPIAPTGMATPYPASSPEMRASVTDRRVPAGWGAARPNSGAATGSDVEAEGPQLFAAVVCDLVRPPRRQPHPVDADVVDQPAARSLAQRLAGLVLDDVGERAGGRGEGHVDGGDVLLV